MKRTGRGMLQPRDGDDDGQMGRRRARSSGQTVSGGTQSRAWRGSTRRLSSLGGTGQTPWAASGRKWQGSQSCPGATELGFPGPALWKMQSEASRRAGEPSGDREEASSEGLGGHQLLTQTDTRGPAGQQLCWLSRRMGNFGGTRTTPCRVIFDHVV